jgi:hypothetical protein
MAYVTGVRHALRGKQSIKKVKINALDRQRDSANNNWANLSHNGIAAVKFMTSMLLPGFLSYLGFGNNLLQGDDQRFYHFRQNWIL